MVRRASVSEDKIVIGSPELTDAELAELRPAREVHGADEFAALTAVRKRGRPKAEAPKVRVTIRLEAPTVQALRASGAGWQTRVSQTLSRVLAEGGMADLLRVPPAAEKKPGPKKTKAYA